MRINCIKLERRTYFGGEEYFNLEFSSPPNGEENFNLEFSSGELRVDVHHNSQYHKFIIPHNLHTRTQDFGTNYLEENLSLRGVLKICIQMSQKMLGS